MTRERKGQLEKPEEALKQDLDEEFLKDLHALGGGRRGDGRGGGFGGGKGKVVKVDRKQFEDVTTKMAKQSTADAFRQRFAPRKAKSRGASEGTGGFDDVDSFLGELKLDGETSPFGLLHFIFIAVISTEFPVLRRDTTLSRQLSFSPMFWLSFFLSFSLPYLSVCGRGFRFVVFADGRLDRSRSESCSRAGDKR